MTTIAWDGVTLAADRGSWSGGFHQAVRKVHKITAPDGRKFLAAFLGNAGFASQVLRWMKGEVEKPVCKPDDLNTDCMVLIDEKRQVWRLTSTLYYVKYTGKIHAAGAGQDIAMGALLAGASATKAVRITIQCSDYAARGVDSVKFKEAS